MKEDEAKEIANGAINEMYEKNLERGKVTLWLYAKFGIAIKDLVFSFEDGMPYLRIEYPTRNKKTKITYISLEKYYDKIKEELEGNKNQETKKEKLNS